MAVRTKKKVATQLENFLVMLETGNLTFSIRDADERGEDRGCKYVRIGDDYCFSIWTFDAEGVFLRQNQYLLE